MHLDSRNWIDSNILFQGAFEPELDEMIDAVLPERGTVLDVGANIGAHTLTMASAVGEDGRVLAFEPNPEVLEVLERNIERNGLQSIATGYGCALGEAQAKMKLRVPTRESKEATNLGLASLVALDTPHVLIDVAIRTADGIVEEHALDRIDFVKIDVQGFECQVLRGMRHCLARFKPVVVFEYERWAWEKGGGDLGQAIEVLEDADYSLWYRVSGGGRRVHADSANEIPDHVNLVAVPRDDRRAVLLRLIPV